MPLLLDLIILLLAAVPVAFIGSRLRLPVIVGFMIAGILIGPSGFGVIGDVPAIEALAEIGVVLLLFSIGLEFSLERILAMKRLMLQGGGLQVVLTTMAASGVVYYLGRPVSQAIFFGFLFALSSTALVLRSYSDRAEIDTPHGQAGTGILLFQDLSVVPMMLAVPILSGKGGVSAPRIALTLGMTLGMLALIILTARIVIPWLLYHVVKLRSQEVFIIFIVLVTLGTSWLTAQFGLSLALGAFVAGLVLSESEYSHQIVSDILPFRDVFNSIFFISIGMLVSVSFVASNILVIMLQVAGLIAGKVLIILLALRLLGTPLRISTMTGMGLAQVGEFSFIVAKAGIAEGLLSSGDYQHFLASACISMMATPFLIGAAPRAGYALQSFFSRKAAREAELEGEDIGMQHIRGHVIIVGYGLNGRNLSTVLRRGGIPYLILEINAETVREAGARGEPIHYGDATRREVLRHAGLAQARIMVVAISDPVATRHTVRTASEMNPDLHIIVRTRYVSEMGDLFQLGASQVIPEEFETSVEIFAHVLQEYGISQRDIQHQVDAVRSEGYQMLRAPSLESGEPAAVGRIMNAASTKSLIIEPAAKACGQTIKELNLRQETGATIIAAIRDGETQVNPDPDFKLWGGDVLVLLGNPAQIDVAIERISGTD
jgi:CPA2 family monovalent cation:H+ antiporter-2